MSEQPNRDDDGSDAGQHSDCKPKAKTRESPRFAPIRWMIYRHRLRQRKDASDNKRTDYGNMPEAEIVPTLYSISRGVARMGIVKAKWWNVIFAFVLTVATIVTVVVMVAQNRIMSRQIEQTDETLEDARLARRAWLAISSIRKAPAADGKTHHFDLEIYARNGGQTPAFVTSQASYCVEIVGFEAGAEFDQREGQPGRMIGLLLNYIGDVNTGEINNYRGAILPDAEVRLAKVHIHDNVPTFKFVAPEPHTGMVIRLVVGCVRYSDANGEKRSTTYCYEMAPDGTFRASEQLNEMH